MKLLTTKDLCERWKLSESGQEAWSRENSVPFLGFGGGDLKVNWNRVRFRPEAIESWEGIAPEGVPDTRAASCHASAITSRGLA